VHAACDWRACGHEPASAPAERLGHHAPLERDRRGALMKIDLVKIG
jgi:hypothetical protein